MDRLEGIKHFQDQQRDEMRTRIDEAIRSMRAQRITITLSTLAEEIGVSRRALYAEYVQSFLKNYPEFNPILTSGPTLEMVSELENNLLATKNDLKIEKKKNKELRQENTILKQKIAETEEKYEFLLGRYQVDVGNKIIQF